MIQLCCDVPLVETNGTCADGDTECDCDRFFLCPSCGKRYYWNCPAHEKHEWLNCIPLTQEPEEE